VNYLVGTSHDGGKQWADTNLPFDDSAPTATVSLSRSASVHIARNASTTVALLTEQFYPDLDAMVAARTAGHQNVSTQQTADGFDMIDASSCVAAKQAAIAAGTGAKDAPATTTVPATPSGAPAEANCNTPPVLGTITWSDLGLHSAADLTRQQMVVSTDGTHWDQVTAPAAGFVSDLVASGDGFLLLADSGRTFTGAVPEIESTLMRSSDARTWTNVPLPTGLSVQAISGNRAIGVVDGVIQASNDGGATWTATNSHVKLPAGQTGTAADTAVTVDAGPLGFAAVVNAETNGTPAHDYLLFSTDGVTWSTSDLATAGMPANTYLSQVIVGADHIGIDFQGAVGTANTPTKTTTLLATPER